MTKAEAIIVILRDARSTRGSKTSLKRVQRALKEFALSEDDAKTILRWLDYFGQDDFYPPYK